MKTRLLLLPLVLLSYAPLRAGLVFSEDFNGISGVITKDNSNFTASSGLYSSLNTVDDTGNLFGEGTGNKIMRVTDNDTSYNYTLTWTGHTGSAVAVLDFDFHIGEGTLTREHLKIALLTGPTSSVVELRLNTDGTASFYGSSTSFTFSIGTTHHVQIVANNTTQTLDGYRDTAPIETGKFSVWIDNEQVINNSVFRVSGPPGTEFQSLLVASLGYGSNLGPVYLDNLVLANTVPEPGSSALLAGAAILGIAATGRRRRAAA